MIFDPPLGDPKRAWVVHYQPFPHVVVDGVGGAAAEAARAEFPPPEDPCWQTYHKPMERGKQGCSDAQAWGPTTTAAIQEFFAPAFRRRLDDLFQLGETPKADTHGGGMHQSPTGALLAMHTDFNRHPRKDLYRRINCLWYLNPGWTPAWGGALELKNPDGARKTIEPLQDRLVIFETAPDTGHGHPVPWAGPEPRRSIAVYYYTEGPGRHPANGPKRSTVWLQD